MSLTECGVVDIMLFQWSVGIYLLVWCFSSDRKCMITTKMSDKEEKKKDKKQEKQRKYIKNIIPINIFAIQLRVIIK